MTFGKDHTIIPKDNRKTRALGIPIVVDRVIQHAVLQVLTQIFEKKFLENSMDLDQIEMHIKQF